MTRAQLMVALWVGISLVGCRGCARSQADEPTLTEKDTIEVPDAIARGANGAWSLALQDADWREVNEAARQKLKPTVQRWFVHASRLSHLTVTCQPDIAVDVVTLEAQTRAAAKSAGRAVSELVSSEVTGDWVHGALVSWHSSKGDARWRNITLRVRVMGASCEAQGWLGPEAGEAAFAELKNTLLRFAGPRPSLERALGSLTRVLSPQTLLAQARLLDAGVSDTASIIVATGLIRLPVDVLVERFTLRRALLERLPVNECASLIRQRGSSIEQVLAKLDDADAVKWVNVSEQAARLAIADMRYVPVEPAAEALAKLNADVEYTKAKFTIDNIGEAPDDALCAAEKTRIDKALALDGALRETVLRAWVK